MSTTEVANVTADLDTRCGELYASDGEVLPAGRADSEDAAADGGGGRRPPGHSAGEAAFAAGRDRFESVIGFLDGADAAGLSHAELEECLDREGRELLRPTAVIACRHESRVSAAAGVRGFGFAKQRRERICASFVR
jgi:hypothetical protein